MPRLFDQFLDKEWDADENMDAGKRANIEEARRDFKIKFAEIRKRCSEDLLDQISKDEELYALFFSMYWAGRSDGANKLISFATDYIEQKQEES